MNKVIFTRKYIIITTILTFFLLSVFLFFEFSLVKPEYKKNTELVMELKGLNQNVSDLHKKKDNINSMEDLLDSDVMKIFRSNDDIQAYLQELENEMNLAGVDVRQLTMSEEKYYQDKSNSDQTIVRKQVAMNISSESESAVFNFIQLLQQETRLKKIEDIQYTRAVQSQGVNGEEKEVYGINMIFYMYYLEGEI